MMMFCFRCKSEYTRGVAYCTECGGKLVYRFPPQTSELSNEGLVVLRTYNNKMQADVAAMTLTAAGIESLVRTNDRAGGALPQMSFIRGIQLVIRSEDLEDADEILSADASGTV
jgi:hypothetical protein